MDAKARRQLVADFIEHCTHQLAWGPDMVLRRQALHPEAIETLDAVSRSNPDEFLDVLLEILHANHSDDVMLHASGPLQMLLETEPDRVIRQVEAMAARDAVFRDLLGWFMPSEPENELWLRVRRAAGDVPW